MKLGRRGSRRRNWRRLSAFGGKNTSGRVLEWHIRRQQSNGSGGTDQVDLESRNLDVGLILGVLATVYGMTKRTWMIAIKSLGDRHSQRLLHRVLHDHRCPGGRLQSDPMQPNCAAKCENGKSAANAAEHGREANDRLSHCQPDRERPPRLELKVQTGAHDVAVRLGIEVGVEGSAVRLAKSKTLSSQVVIKIFELDRPMTINRVSHTTADRPAKTNFVGRTITKAIARRSHIPVIEYADVAIGEDSAAGGVN